MAIDIFSHILPIKYKKSTLQVFRYIHEREKDRRERVTLANDEADLRILDAFEGVAQVLWVTLPPLEEVVSSQEAVELARLSNDEMPDLVATHPKKFIAAIANLPLNNTDAALKEAERAIKGMDIPLSTKKKIYEENARTLLPL
jgi:predicted TIM-barrel fold metal-dependent hydrolase